MRKAIIHALASSTDTTTPLLVVMVISAWEDTLWYSATIRSHPNLETLIQIPTGHMRFVSAHEQSDGDTTSLPPAKWLFELVFISNKEGRDQLVCMDRINQILAPAVRNVCHMSAEHLKFFPNTRAGGGLPANPPLEHTTRPFPVCPAPISPQTQPTGNLGPFRHSP